MREEIYAVTLKNDNRAIGLIGTYPLTTKVISRLVIMMQK